MISRKKFLLSTSSQWFEEFRLFSAARGDAEPSFVDSRRQLLGPGALYESTSKCNLDCSSLKSIQC